MEGRGPRSREPRGDRIRAARSQALGLCPASRTPKNAGLRGRPGGPRRAPHVLSPPRSPSRTPSLRPSGLVSPPGPSGGPTGVGAEMPQGAPSRCRALSPAVGKSGVAAGLRLKGPECLRFVWTGWVQRPSWGRALGLPLAAARGGRSVRLAEWLSPLPTEPLRPTHSPASPRGLLRGPPAQSLSVGSARPGPAQHAEPAGTGGEGVLTSRRGRAGPGSGQAARPQTGRCCFSPGARE